MNLVLSIILIITFIILSIIHFYWAFGGKMGIDKALPTDEKGKKVLNPKMLETLIVGLGLFLFAAYYFLKLDFLLDNLHPLIDHYAGWLISSIFILRAIGDFNYIGFFRKVKRTEFAILDKKYYSPLSFTMGFIGIILELLTNTA